MAHLAVCSLSFVCILLLNILSQCEMSIYPGLRRKPLQQAMQQPFEMSSDFLAQLMEENARRRLQQQFEHQLELINMQMSRQRQQQERYRQLQAMQAMKDLDSVDSDEDYVNNNNNQYDQYDNPNAEFSYKYAESNDLNRNPEPEVDDEIEERPFAVGPSDPRFFDQDSNREDDNNLDPQTLDEYEEYVPAESRPKGIQVTAQPEPSPGAADPAVLAPAEISKHIDSVAAATYHRIKPPQNAAPAAVVATVDGAPMKPVQNVAETRHDISALIEKLQKEGKSETILNNNIGSSLEQDAHVVVRHHLGMDGEMGVYVVALIAGVSAAITVGLIALGVAWYTLHNKTKAAADVEYPAYGVTGPNKDISPSGDRKLAQSAQMYHYQHQKQQIIAMENRQAVEGNSGLSDVESDDDNEEGDYTVYECPGLAPTGEMEVKNPLFLDETPMTPAGNIAVAPVNNVTQATPQQPQTTTRKATGKATTSMATSSEENTKHQTKKNKK